MKMGGSVVIHNGVRLGTISDAAKRFGITRQAMWFRVKNHPEDYSVIPYDNKVPVIIKGKRYESVSEAMRFYDLTHQSITYRLRSLKHTDFYYEHNGPKVGGDVIGYVNSYWDRKTKSSFIELSLTPIPNWGCIRRKFDLKSTDTWKHEIKEFKDAREAFLYFQKRLSLLKSKYTVIRKSRPYFILIEDKVYIGLQSAADTLGVSIKTIHDRINKGTYLKF